MTGLLLSSILPLISCGREITRCHSKAMGGIMNKNLIHTPEGVRDTYGTELTKKKKVMNLIKKQFLSYGYMEIETPTFEFFDVFSNEIGTIPSKELFKFFDKEGNTLVLRPDFTPSMARCATKYFMHESLPIRFSYAGNTFTNKSELQGKLKENTELGIEYIGDSSVEADVEMICLLIDTLKNLGMENFKINIGQVDFFKGLCEEAGLDYKTEALLRTYISNKNFFGVEEVLNEKKIPTNIKNILIHISDMFGSIEAIEQSKKIIKNKRSLEAIENLEKINRILVSCNNTQYISYDLGMLSKYNYYTGIIFEAYTYGVGDAIAKGGRYDSLLKHFGKDSPAIGLVLAIGNIMTTLNRQKIKFNDANTSFLLLYDSNSYKETLSLATKLRLLGENVQITSLDFLKPILSNTDQITDLIESRQISDLIIAKNNLFSKMNLITNEFTQYTINEIIGAYNE